jgi:hypothetical protein
VDNLRQRQIDPSSEGIEVRVFRAENHAALRSAGIVKAAKMLAIVCQYGSAFCVRKCQYFLVWDPQTSQAHLSYREYVVPELPQSFDGWDRKVFISEETGQRLGLLILSDLTLNLIDVTGNKRPGVD